MSWQNQRKIILIKKSYACIAPPFWNMRHSNHFKFMKRAFGLLLLLSFSLFTHGYNSGKSYLYIGSNLIGYAIEELVSTIGDCFVSEAKTYAISSLVSSTQQSKQCSGTYILGGYNILGPRGRSTMGQYFKKSYTGLKSHNMIYFSFTLYEIDSWDTNDYLNIVFDARTFNTWKQSFKDWSYSTNTCGSSTVHESIYRLFGQVKHSSSSLTLKFVMQNDDTSEAESAGFRDIRLLFATTTGTNTETMCAVSKTTIPSMKCSCPENKYSSGSSCLTCNNLCKTCFGGSSSQCYQCASGAGFTGVGCVQCHSSCSACHGPGEDQCDACPSGMILFNQKYCVNPSAVVPPLQTKTTPCSKYSTGKCDPNMYLYSDGSCLQVCNAPMIADIKSLLYMTCSIPCSSNTYLYWNGSCLSTCEPPLYQDIPSSGTKSCVYPCMSDEYLNWDGICLDSCGYPKNIRNESSALYCDLPCPQSEYLADNGTCISSCLSPMVIKTVENASLCTNPCGGKIPYYSLDDHTCISSCAFPSTILYFSSYTGCQIPISSQENEAIGAMASLINNMANVSSATLVATSIFSFSDPGCMSVAMLTKMLQFTKFVRVTHTVRLELILLKTKIRTGFLPFAPKIPLGLNSSLMSRDLPDEFERYKVQSEFLVSFWDGLMSISIAFVLYFLVLILSLGTKRFQQSWFISFGVQKARVILQNFLLTQFYACYGDIILFSILNLSTAKFDTLAEILSCTTAIIFMGLGIIIFVLHYLFLTRYQRIKNQPNTNTEANNAVNKLCQKHEGIHVLFFGFRDRSLVTQSLFILLIIRSIAFSMIITLLYRYPFVQAVMTTVLCTVMICYLLISRPFKRLVDLAQQLTIECIILTVSVSLLGIAIIDSKSILTKSAWLNFNEIIIMCNLIVFFVAPTFLIIKLILLIIQYFKNRKRETLKKRQVQSISQASFDMNNKSDLKPINVSNTENRSILTSAEPNNRLMTSAINLETTINQETSLSTSGHLGLLMTRSLNPGVRTSQETNLSTTSQLGQLINRNVSPETAMNQEMTPSTTNQLGHSMTRNPEIRINQENSLSTNCRLNNTNVTSVDFASATNEDSPAQDIPRIAPKNRRIRRRKARQWEDEIRYKEQLEKKNILAGTSPESTQKQNEML